MSTPTRGPDRWSALTPAPDQVGRGRPNPFQSDLARANSTYAAFRDDQLVCALDPQRSPSQLEEDVHRAFRALILRPEFSCLGARAAVRSGQYRQGVYREMSSPEATAGLARDLFAFVEEQDDLKSGFTTFVAAFSGPRSAGEVEFERLLWAQLQNLHDQDRLHHRWDPSVSSDPEHGSFSFSFAERAFFVVGLHPASSRRARRFAWPALVFNAHRQFEWLRERGHFGRMQRLIRARERAIEGSVNPNLSDFGARSEARQYSGRAVEEGWRCPLHVRAEE